MRLFDGDIVFFVIFRIFMVVFKICIDWFFFCLWFVVGGMVFLVGFEFFRYVVLFGSLVQVGYWGFYVVELLCGVFMLLGLWMLVVSFGLMFIIGWLLVQGWFYGVVLLGNFYGLFFLFVVFVFVLGGVGKWVVGRS